jgi:hypothetical protein
MVSTSQAKPSCWLHLTLASGLGFMKPSQASQAMASIGTKECTVYRCIWGTKLVQNTEITPKMTEPPSNNSGPIHSWLPTASAGFPNWESDARQGFGQAKPAVMCRTRLKRIISPRILQSNMITTPSMYKMYNRIQSYRINIRYLYPGGTVRKTEIVPIHSSETSGLYLSTRGRH